MLRIRALPRVSALLVATLVALGAAAAHARVIALPRVDVQVSVGNNSFLAQGIAQQDISTDYRSVFPDTDVGECTFFACRPIVNGIATAYADSGFQVRLPLGGRLGFPGYARTRARVDMTFSEAGYTAFSNRAMTAYGSVQQYVWLVRRPLPPGVTLPDELGVRMQGMLFFDLKFDRYSVSGQYARFLASLGGAGITAEVRFPNSHGAEASDELQILFASASGFCDDAAVEAALRSGLVGGSAFIDFCVEYGIGGGDPSLSAEYRLDVNKSATVTASVGGGSGSGSSFDPSQNLYGSVDLSIDPVFRLDTESLGALAPYFELFYPEENYPESPSVEEALAELDPVAREHLVGALEDFYDVDLSVPVPEPGVLAQQLLAAAILGALARRA